MKCLKRLSLNFTAVALSTAVVATGLTLNVRPASAQAAYGSYVGIGPSFGLTEGGSTEGRKNAGVLAVRYKLLEVPVSLRAQALLFNDTTAVVPTVSYDVPLNWQTDVYIGAGYSFSNGGAPSPVGNKNAFAIQPGIDYSVPNSNMVIFGNAIIAFDAYRQSGGTAASIQGGVGLRF